MGQICNAKDDVDVVNVHARVHVSDSDSDPDSDAKRVCDPSHGSRSSQNRQYLRMNCEETDLSQSVSQLQIQQATRFQQVQRMSSVAKGSARNSLGVDADLDKQFHTVFTLVFPSIVHPVVC